MDTAQLAGMRRAYTAGDLDAAALDPDPVRQFAAWFADAEAAGLPEPNAVILATASAGGAPNARVVLLKGCDERGFVFYTHLNSTKGRELAENPRAALVLPWYPMGRQVRVQGPVEPVDRAEVAGYFAVRPRGSQLGAWASEQSTVVGSRADIEEGQRRAEARFAGAPVPVPEHWGGLRLRPETVEFWQGRPHRLHDRFRYRRTPGGWRVDRLAP